MTITATDIYLVSAFGRLGSIAALLSIVLIAVSFICTVILLIEYDRYTDVNPFTIVIKRMLCAGLICSLLATFIPSRIELASMYVIPAVVNNDDIRAASSDSLKALRILSEKWLESLVKDK